MMLASTLLSRVPRWCSSKESICPMQEIQETWVQSLGQEDPLGNDNPLQYSYLENSVDRGAWLATVHGGTKSWMQLSTHTTEHATPTSSPPLPAPLLTSHRQAPCCSI